MSLRTISTGLLIASLLGAIFVVGTGAYRSSVESRLEERHDALASLQTSVNLFSVRSDALLLHDVTEDELDAYVRDARSLQEQLAAWRDVSAAAPAATDTIDRMVGIAREHAGAEPVSVGAPRVGPLRLPAPSVARISRMATLGWTLDATMRDLTEALDRLAERRHAWAEGSTAATALGFVVLMLAVAVTTRRGLGRPLTTLTGIADRVAEGDHTARAPERGPTELRLLARALNAALARHGRDQELLAETNRELTERSRHLAEAQRIAQVGSVSWDPVHGAALSEETYRITGTHPDAFEPTLEASTQLLDPDDRPRLLALREALRAGETTEALLLRLRRPDGERRLVRIWLNPTLDADGRVVHVEGSLQDVTEVIGIERELEEERRLRETAGRLGRVGGWSLDVPSMKLHWSDLVREIHETPPGYVPDVEQGIAFYAPRARPVIRDAVKRAIDRGEPYDLELEIDTAMGRRIWIRTVGHPVRDPVGRMVALEGAFADIDERKRSEERAVELDRRLRTVLDAISDGFIAVSEDGSPVFVNDAARRLLGQERLLAQTPVWDLLPASVDAEIGTALRAAVRERRNETFIAADVPRDRWLEFSVEPAAEHVAVLVRDVSERARLTAQLFAREAELVRARDQLEASLELRETLMSALPAHVALVDADGTILEINERWREFGRENGARDPDHSKGRNYLEIARAARGSGSEHAHEVARGLEQVLRGEREILALEYPCHAPDQQRWFLLEARRVPSPEAGDDRAVVMHVDVTESHLARERLAALAFEDPLTGILNRAGLLRELREPLENDWPGNHLLASLDIRGMGAINDLHGFELGDALLRSIARRLQGELEPSELAARVGGDEFALLVGPSNAGDDGGPCDAMERLERIVRDGIEAPHDLTADLRLTVEAHVGLTALDDRPRSAEEVLREAQIALFEGDEGPGPTWSEYDEHLDRKVHGRHALADELRAAIAGDELHLHFHPEVCTRSGELYAAEALVRWRHPERGLLSPAMFVPLAEQTGLIASLGRWVLNEACRKLAGWRDAMGLTRIAVNASAEELLAGDYADAVLATLAKHDVAPSMLTVEVTESVFARESGVVAEQLRALRESGVRVALDDFGTGYASLAYLKTFPFDYVKIDRMFVSDMLVDAYSRGVIATIVTLARTLGASVIAEGVETEQQRSMLVESGCEIAQGYYFSLPLDEEDFEWLLETRRTLPWVTPG